MHTRVYRIGWLPLGLFGIVSAGVLLTGYAMGVGADHRASFIGRPMDIEGQMLDGQPLDWSKYRGKTVLVEFWARWCPDCVGELDSLRGIYEADHHRGFEVVGISLDEDRQQLVTCLREHRIPWTILFQEDPERLHRDQSMAARYRIRSVPALFLVGPDGKVVSMPTTSKQVGEDLRRLLNVATKGAKT